MRQEAAWTSGPAESPRGCAAPSRPAQTAPPRETRRRAEHRREGRDRPER